MSKSWGEIREEALRRCGQLPPKTNADRIRSMSDEELADYLRYYSDSYARYDMDWLDWLRQEDKRNDKRNY